jgi:hypothetical protein
MKNTAYKYLAIGFVLASASAANVFAQEYFSKIASPDDLTPVKPPTVEATESANANPADRVSMVNPGTESASGAGDKYNIALGPVHFGVAVGVGLEYNDNVNLGDKGNEISDFAVRPSLTLDSTYQFSEMNTIHLSLGVSYAKYFSHSEFDTRGLLLSPNSVLAFTFHVGNFQVTLRDRFSYQEDAFSAPVLSNVTNYRRLENLVGIQVDWAANDLFKVSAGYDHYNLWTFDDTYASLDRSIETLYVKPAYLISPSVSVGLDASVSFVNFKENVQNGGTSYLAGPFVDAELTQNTRLYAEVGYQDFTFDRSGTVNDQSDSNSWYARTSISNRLSESFSQRLSFTKTAEVGYGSNYYELYHLEYAADWKITQNLTIDPSVFYEHYKTSTPVGLQAESADRYGAAIGFRYVLTPSITLGLDYRYLFKNSNLPNLDYRQNLVLLSAYYNF